MTIIDELLLLSVGAYFTTDTYIYLYEDAGNVEFCVNYTSSNDLHTVSVGVYYTQYGKYRNILIV